MFKIYYNNHLMMMDCHWFKNQPILNEFMGYDDELN